MALSKKVKTAFLGGGLDLTGKASVAAGVPHLGSLTQWVPQDNVRIIGTIINMEIDVRDADSNTDNEAKGMVELTRAATIEQDGCINRVEMQHIWNGLFSIAGDLRKQLVVMFPDGYGIDIDEGNPVNLVAYWSVTGGGPIDFFGSCLIYYVER